MADGMPLRSLERNGTLVLASIYERDVPAALDAVWENVFDWEHLPWLHGQAFSAIELREAGDWGWHADVAFAGGAQSEIELVVDRIAGCYVARTRSGAGAPGETWTRLEEAAPEQTHVRVEFWQPAMPAARLAEVGARFRALYQGLWDQDQEMIVVREATAPAKRRAAPVSAAAPEPVDLGPWTALRARLPLVREFGGQRFRIVLLDERPQAYAAECPHWRGPLHACAIETDGIVTCPWHGYRFDVRTGASADGRGLRLRRPPRVVLDDETGHVWLRAAG